MTAQLSNKLQRELSHFIEEHYKDGKSQKFADVRNSDVDGLLDLYSDVEWWARNGETRLAGTAAELEKWLEEAMV